MTEGRTGTATAAVRWGRRNPHGSPVARRSPLLCTLFGRHFERFFARHLNALRLAEECEPRLPPGAGPVVVFTNHPSWWDAVLYVICARRLFPTRDSYAPISAAMLARYPFFGRIGAFGVEDGPRGAATFLSRSSQVLSQPNRLLWLAAQGRFSDVRERPLGLKRGIAHLPELAPDALFLPLAIEYAFWSERGAEALLGFGQARSASDLLLLSRDERRQALESDLTASMDHLAQVAISRDAARFRTVVDGRAGVGGVYDAWRRMQSAVKGRSFDPAHGAPP